MKPNPARSENVSGKRGGGKEHGCVLRYGSCFVLQARRTCQVQSEGDEAVISSQELQRFLPLHQSPEVICKSFSIEEVVDAHQKVPEAKKQKEHHFSSVCFRDCCLRRSQGLCVYAVSCPLYIDLHCLLVCAVMRGGFDQRGKFQLAVIYFQHGSDLCSRLWECVLCMQSDKKTLQQSSQHGGGESCRRSWSESAFFSQHSRV